MSHHHHHHHEPRDFGRAYAIGVSLNIVYVVLEFAFGVWTHSLALMADAGHNLGDVLSLVLAWGASILAKRSPSQRRTYGMRRASILAGMMNGALLMAAAGAIAWEAILRFGATTTIASSTVMIVATVGILINGLTAWMFSSHDHDVNVRGAYLHMAADAAVSLGVVIAAALIYWTGWQWIDPTISLIIVGVIAVSTWGLLRDSVNLIMDAVPNNVDPTAIRSYFKTLPEVASVHDLHIWAMSTTEVALTAHLVKRTPIMDDALLSQIHRELHDRYGIEHATIQFETGSEEHPCGRSGEHC